MMLRCTGRLPSLTRIALAAIVGLAATSGRADVSAIESAYLFRLADLHGSIPMSWPSLSVDPTAHELYVNDRTLGEVRVFGRSGMELQSFGQDDTFGTILGVAALPGGDLFVLAWTTDRRTALVRCDFRGEPRDEVKLRGLPEQFAKGFSPGALRIVGDRIYLADKDGMKVAVVDETGGYQASYDFHALLKVSAKKKDDARMSGFNVDRAGNLLFTIGPFFTAYVVSPTGEVRSFGTRGSAPGKFNIVGAIAADDRGYLYVTDILRAVVMVFDPRFEFLGEFGYRGWGPDNLIAPVDVAVDDGKVFVAQGAMRGVSVFRVSIRDGATGGG
jgi:hypothetical protein